MPLLFEGNPVKTNSITDMHHSTHHLLRSLLLGAIVFGQSSAGNAQAAKKPESVANILPEGAFDTRTTQFFAGWKVGGYLGGVPGESRTWDNSVTMETDENGTGFARIMIKDRQGTSLGISQTEALVLNPAWTSLNLKVSARVTEFKKEADWGGTCQFSLTFNDDADQPIPGDFKTGISKNTSGWEEIGTTITIPKGAANLSVQILFMGATGVLDVKNLRVFPIDLSSPPISR